MRRALFLAAICAIALSLRILFITGYDGGKFLSQDFYSGDSVAYDSIALNWMQGAGFVSNDGYKAKYGPIYPMFLAGIYRVGAHDVVLVRFVQALLGVLSCLIVFFIAKGLFNEPAARIAALGAAVYYPCIQMPAYIIAEETYVFVLLVAVLCAVQLISRPGLSRAVAAGIAYGVAVLCKGALSGFVPLFLLGVYCAMDAAPKRKVTCLAVFLLALSAVLLPWTLRNYAVFDAFVPVTIHSGDLLYKGNSPGATGGSGGLHTRGVDFIDLPDTPGLNEYERDRFLKQKAVEFITENPKRVVELACVKFWNMWRPYHTDTRFISKLVMCCSYTPIVIFAFIGLLYSLRSWRRYLIFYLLFAYYIGLHMILIGIIRYRYPMEPFLIIFAAYGFWCLHERLSRRSARAAENVRERG